MYCSRKVTRRRDEDKNAAQPDLVAEEPRKKLPKQIALDPPPIARGKATTPVRLCIHQLSVLSREIDMLKCVDVLVSPTPGKACYYVHTYVILPYSNSKLL